MKKYLFLLGFVYLNLQTVFSLETRSQKTVDSLAVRFYKVDNLEEFTYACVDLYLIKPSEARLSIFEDFENNRWRQARTNEEYLAHVILLSNKGYYLARFGDILESTEAYETARKLYTEHQLDGFDITEYALKPLGNNYSMLGDYNSAENIIKEYLFNAGKQRNQLHILSGIINLSIVYHDTGRNRQAIDLLQHTLTLQKIPLDKKGLLYSMLAGNYESEHDLAHARQYAQLALQIAKDPVQQVNLYKLLATIRLEESIPDAALAYFEKANNIAAMHSGVFKNRELAKLSIDFADLLKQKRRFDAALNHYHKALVVLLPAYLPEKSHPFPSPSLLYAENSLKETFDGLADLCTQLNKPEEAIQWYTLSFSVEDILRKTYNYQESKIHQQTENRIRTEKAIDLLYRMFMQTGNYRFVRRAFQIAEKTKSLVLRESIEDKYLKDFIKHDPLVRRQRNLLFKQASLADQINLEKREKKIDIDHLNDLTTAQTDIALQIRSLERELKTKYPQLENQGIFVDSVRLNGIQKKLRADHAVLFEYVSSHSQLFIFIVTPDSILLKKTDDATDLNLSIHNFSTLFVNSSTINNQVESYKKIAYDLYQQLQLNDAAAFENIVIIPDGLLNNIPFDALLTEDVAGHNYSTFPFLITKHTITYQPSSLLYLGNDNRNSSLPDRHLLGMFPVFEDTDLMLEYSLKEAEHIRGIFPEGKYFFRKQATKRAFLENASHHSMIHLSTHAFAGNEDEPPAIHFIDSALHLNQIYGMHLTTNLLVLSACETGVGKITYGEGALSLARGFQFAGVRNVILSLWKANDQSTAILFSGFYEHYLESGLKALALQQAKLDYLADDAIQNSKKSPFFWATFIYSGELSEGEINGSKFFKRLTFFFVVSLLMGILILYRLKSRRKD